MTFWRGSALREAIAGGTEVHLPDLVTRHGELFSWLWKRREDGASFALARVIIGAGAPSAARADAKDTVRALLALAEFDEGYTAWRVAERGLLHFVDDQWVFREQLGPGRQPKALDLARIARDNTPAALRARAPSVGPKLPLRATTVDVRHAFELLHWLAQGRATPGPARIVLTKRVIERAAGWAQVKEDTFTDQQLAIPWARRQTLSRISEANSAALAVLKDAADNKHRTWLEAHNEPRRIIVGYPGSRTAIDTAKALEHLEWFAKDLEADSEAGDELDRLRPLVANGAAYADWIDRLLEQFGHLRRRYSRHRMPSSTAAPSTTNRSRQSFFSLTHSPWIHSRRQSKPCSPHFPYTSTSRGASRATTIGSPGCVHRANLCTSASACRCESHEPVFEGRSAPVGIPHCGSSVARQCSALASSTCKRSPLLNRGARRRDLDLRIVVG